MGVMVERTMALNWSAHCACGGLMKIAGFILFFIGFLVLLEMHD
jgi:hypothetical protein